jgi:hypothetical protein
MKRADKAAFWMGHLAAMTEEAIPATAYARQHGLSVKSLYGWQRKVAAGADRSMEPVCCASFVALRVDDPGAALADAGCTLVLGSGLRLEMSALPPPQWLAALGRATHGVA